MKAGSAQTLLLVAGLVVTATLALALVRTRAQRAELLVRAETVTRDTMELDRRAKGLRAEVAQVAETVAGQRVRVSVLLSPAERTSQGVGASVARLKAQHAAHPPPAPLPPPPLPRDGAQGMVFLELMGDAEYARCWFTVFRDRLEDQHRKILEALGCDPRTVAEALDLLAEQEMVRYDLRSLDPTAAASPMAGPAERSLRLQLNQQLRRLLGEANYARFEEPGVTFTTTVKPDGTREQASLPGIPLVRLEARQRSAVEVLAKRLSYSDAPLESSQREALVMAFMALPNVTARQTNFPEQWSDPAIATAFRTVLKPGQWPAVEALQEETEAYRQRSQLPAP